jgi:N-dimethylarginine dimethylaminohydrolase
MRRVLLCPPEYYAIEYEINPWMDRARKAEPALALAQWQQLRDKLSSLGCEIEVLKPQPGLPDMVFTANAGLVAGRKFIRSNFRFPQRRGEEEHFESWFAQRDYIPDLVDVSPAEAARFACNAVVLDKEIVLPEGCPELSEQLVARGYHPHPLPMSEFMKAGGACKCLTLLLPQKPVQT